MELREKLRDRRKSLGLTFRGLAARISADGGANVDFTTLHGWESGRREPDDDDRRRWGAALGIDVQIVARAAGEPGGLVDLRNLTEAQRSMLEVVISALPRISDAEAKAYETLFRSIAERPA